MNHLVLLDPHTGELEKILSGTKSMILAEINPTLVGDQAVTSGDNLYFMKDDDEYALQVKATVGGVLYFSNHSYEDLSHLLKEMQPRLQLTEEQYNLWSLKPSVLFVEFHSAQKIDLVFVSAEKISDLSGWIPFNDFNLIM